MRSNLNPSASVVIPAFNEERYIEETLKSLKQSDYPEKLWEIIVVDNGSEDRTVELAQKYADKVLILEQGNVGAVRNLGSKNSNSNILIFLDADCVIDKSWISRGISAITESSDHTHIYGGSYKVRANANWIERLWLLENPNHPRLQRDLLGGCIFIEKKTFNNIGGFNEQMTSGEDSELSARLREHGFTVKVKEELSVVHLGNPRTLTEFFKRQVWHSENYLKFIRNSVKDYMFWILILFISSVTTLTVGVALGKLPMASLGLLGAISLAILLSIKRIALTKFIPRTLTDGLGIICLDMVYLSARSLGLMKPLFRKNSK